MPEAACKKPSLMKKTAKYRRILLKLSGEALGGTGNPYFSTDTAAALRANEIGAEVILKATKVDGIYDSDPKKNPKAKRYSQISYQEALFKRLKVMDSTAFSLCQDNKMPIIVFDLFKPHNLRKVVMGVKVGTLVTG